MKGFLLLQRWLVPIGFGLLALVAPVMVVYAIVLHLDQPSGDQTVSSISRLIITMLVVIIFWVFTVSLLIRRYEQDTIRLLFVHGQVLAITLVYPLAYPSPWTQPPGLLRLSIVGFYFLAPLTLQMHITFPVRLGTAQQRRWLLRLLYLLALLSMLAWLSNLRLLLGIGEIFTLFVFAASIVVLVYAYLFRATSDERRRLRVIWFVPLLTMLLGNLLYFVPGLYGLPTRMPVWLLGLILIVVPVSYLYAITRQNLFGIDRFFNRTLVYLILTSAIFAIYLGPLIYLYNVLPGDWLVQALLAAAITLAIAWNFSWLRTRVERLVDKLFYGSWYDYPGVVESISEGLARCTDHDQLEDVLARKVPSLMNLQPGSLLVGDPAIGSVSLISRQKQFVRQFQGDVPAQWIVGPRLDGDPLSSVDVRILNTLAKQAEIALNNVVLIERLRRQLQEIRASREALAQIQHQLLRSREEERSRLARDLHDGPLQALIGMNMQLGMLIASSTTPAGGLAERELSELRVAVRSLLNDLRGVCAELRPPMLDTLGLGAALRALTEEWSEQYGISLEMNLPIETELRGLPDQVAVNLYRIAQEALANTARHAGANQTSVSLHQDGNGLELIIQDNGCGFSMPDALHELASAEHYGLVGMRERVEAIGGVLVIDTKPGCGTQIRVSL